MEEVVKISNPPSFNTASMLYLERHAILLGNFIILKKSHVKSMAISPDTYSVILSTLPTTDTLCDSHLFTGLPLQNMAKRVDCPSSALLLNILHWQLDLLSQLVRNTV